MTLPETGTVAFVVKGYPRLSETFIAQEILALERRGLVIRIVSLRHPTDRYRHPVHREITAAVDYLPEYLYREPGRVWRAWRACRGRPAYRRALRLWWRDFRRDPTPNRGRRFGQALVLAHELPPAVVRLHAHFLHTPASVARYAAILAGLPWSCSAHAKDIWTSPAWEKAEKLEDCEWLVTCTRAGADHLTGLAPEADIALVYHGLDLGRFPPPPARPEGPAGAAADRPVMVLSVGRKVAKKGYDVLLEALHGVTRDLHWRFVHVGGGDLQAVLAKRAGRFGLAGRIDWLGPQPQEVVIEQLRRADLFVLPSRVADDGDRDGLPNVLMEAMSQGVACVATDISGIPELIEDGVSGVLVPPDDPAALGRAIADLARDPARRLRIGRAAIQRVATHFDMERCIGRLAERFGQQIPAPDRVAD